MANIVNHIFNIVSALTLSGLSEWAQFYRDLCPGVVIMIMIIVNGPFNLYSRIFKIHLRRVSKTEIISYLSMIAAAFLLVLFHKENNQVVALILMFTGGFTFSFSGGIGIDDFVNGIILLGKSISVKTHPNAVVTTKKDGRTVTDEETATAASRILLYFVIQLILAFIISFEALTISDAFLISAAALYNGGWILITVCGNAAIAMALSPGMKLFLCAVMILARLAKIKHIKNKRSL